MAWQGPPRKRSDPLLNTKAWAAIRKHWRTLRQPCARCGRAIDYDGPARLPNGRINKRSLVVGHIVSRYHAKRMGWTDAQINDITNTQPECRACSDLSGQRLGQRVAQARVAARQQHTDYTRRW
jgi:hypothetical protein